MIKSLARLISGDEVPMAKASENNHKTILWICVTGLFMALNIIMSSFSIPVPGGHLYLNDVIIDTAALLMDPLSAFLVGGVGAFLGDLFFYPTPMFVSLVTHGLQAVAISILSRKILKKDPKIGSIPALAVGAVIMVAGYTFGRAYIYGTPEAAVLKLPYQILQAVVGAVGAWLLVWKCGLKKLYRKSFE